MPPVVHLVRHGQGLHQIEPIEQSRQLPDPPLTELGVQRCQDFNTKFPDYVHIDLVCASPMRRAIQTAQYCFASIMPTTALGKILLLPLAQEDTALPCDTGSEPVVIRREFGDMVDSSAVVAGWNSKTGMNAPTPAAVKSRAKVLRQWLKARPEKAIVVVCHGAIAQFLAGEEEKRDAVPWVNREWRWYRFDEDSGDEARLCEEQQSILRRNALAG